MPTAVDVLGVQSAAFSLLSFCWAQDLATLQLVCRQVQRAVQQQAPRILGTLYDVTFPPSARHRTQNSLHLLAQCEAATSLYLSLTALGMAAQEPMAWNGAGLHEKQLVATDLHGATCFSIAQDPAAQVDAFSYVPLVICQAPVAVPPTNSVDCHVCCYDDFVTEVSEDSFKTVHLIKVLSSGVVLFVAERYEWDIAASSTTEQTSTSSCQFLGPHSQESSRLVLYQAQRHTFGTPFAPLALPLPCVQDIYDLGEGAVALVGGNTTLVLDGAVKSHPGHTHRRHRDHLDRLPPIWTVDRNHCGTIPHYATDVVRLPNGNVATLANRVMQEWHLAEPHDSPTLLQLQCCATHPIPFLHPPPAPPSNAPGDTSQDGPSTSDGHAIGSENSLCNITSSAEEDTPNALAQADIGNGSRQKVRPSRSRSSQPDQSSQSGALLQFVATNVVVGVVEDGLKVRTLMGWQVGQKEAKVIDHRGAGERYKLVRPANSSFFAFTVSSMTQHAPSACGVVDIASLSMLREIPLVGWSKPVPFGPNLLCVSRRDQMKLFDGKQEVIIPTSWRGWSTQDDDGFVCPMSSTSVLVWESPAQGPHILHFLLLDQHRAKLRRNLLHQQPSNPPTLRPLTDFYPQTMPNADGAGSSAASNQSKGSACPQASKHQARSRSSSAKQTPTNGIIKKETSVSRSNSRGGNQQKKKQKSNHCDSHSGSGSKAQDKWTLAEDEALRAGVSAFGEGKWIQIYNCVPALSRHKSTTLKDRWAILQAKANP